MRIISGTRRGHKLYEFDGTDIRPTTDRVRESLFNLICDFVPQSRVLDLFGGSGALSFEALSRGAKNAVICDIDKRSLSLIKRNAEKLKLCANIDVLETEARKFVAGNRQEFDIIFLDPPYNKDFISPVIEDIVSCGTLASGGIIVLESDSTDEHGEFSGLEIIKQKKYGRTYITIYQRGDK